MFLARGRRPVHGGRQAWVLSRVVAGGRGEGRGKAGRTGMGGDSDGSGAGAGASGGMRRNSPPRVVDGGGGTDGGSGAVPDGIDEEGDARRQRRRWGLSSELFRGS